jgi:hypothetical protein
MALHWLSELTSYHHSMRTSIDELQRMIDAKVTAT